MEKQDDIHIFTVNEMEQRAMTELAIRELEESASRPLASEADCELNLRFVKVEAFMLKGKVKKGPGKGRAYFKLFLPKSYLNQHRGKHRSLNASMLTMKREFSFQSPPVSAEQQERLKQVLIKARRVDLGLDETE